MSRVRVTTKIKAPVDRVWKTVMNPDCLQHWVTIHRSVEAVSSRPLHEGSTMDQVLHMRGVSFHVHWTLVEVNQPTHAEWAGVGPAHSRARIRYDLTAAGAGATQFEYMNEFTPPNGPLGTVASRVIVGAASEREAEKSLRRLKALLEHLTGRTDCRLTEQAGGQHVAETFFSMINTHDPGLLDRFVAEDYRDHNAFVTDGREANRRFWTAFFAAIADLGSSLDEAADDAVAGDDRVRGWVRRRAMDARRLVRTLTESLIATINHKEPTWPQSTVRSWT